MWFSLGFSLAAEVQAAVLAIPEDAWVPAYDLDGRPRKGAWVAEITDMLDLTKWPTGSRVIIRRERPHPGAQLRFTDTDGPPVHRFHHRHHRRATRRPRSPPPKPRPGRRPDPLWQSNRPAQLPLPRLRREQSRAGTAPDGPC